MSNIQNIKSQAKIRFSDTTNEWKTWRIGEILTEKNRPVVLQDDKKYQLVTVKRRNEGVVSRGYLKGKDILVKNYFEVEEGDYIISKRQIVHGANGLVPKSLHKAVISNEYLVAISNEKITTDYWALISKLPDMYKKFFLSSYGVDIEKLVFDVEDWKKREITIPEVNEQRKITKFFFDLDKIISSQSKKYIKIKNLKKAMLEKMFPKNGSNLPEIRFKGFSEKWIESSLSEIGNIQSGIGFPEREQGGTSGIPFYKVSDMNILGNETKMTKSNNYVTKEQVKLKNWKPIKQVPAIIFAKVGAALMLNRKRLVQTPFLIDNNTMSYSFNDSWHEYFGKTLFDTLDLTKYAQVGALPSYNGRDIEKIKIKRPYSKSEQNKIGEFFKEIDNSIAQHKKQLIELKKLKLACFEKMTKTNIDKSPKH